MKISSQKILSGDGCLNVQGNNIKIVLPEKESPAPFREKNIILDNDMYLLKSHYKPKVSAKEHLDRAIHLQKNGLTNSAVIELKRYKSLIKEPVVDYYICIGKIISQKTKEPEKLESYIKSIRLKKIKPEEISSLYWRLSLIYSPKNKKISNYYLKYHLDSSSGGYQVPHNIQCNAINIVHSGETNRLYSVEDILQSSYEKYLEIDGFKYLEKCIISNIIIRSLIYYISGSHFLCYTKIFFCRLFLLENVIAPSDEAMSEIFFLIRKKFPEIYVMLFTKKLAETIKNNKNGKEMYYSYMKALEYYKYCNENNITVKDYYSSLMDNTI